MKKKVFLAVCLTVVLLLVSSCMMMSGSGLESMFGSGSSNQNTGLTPSVSGDSVTISRADYEEYLSLKKFSELAFMYDYASENFYREPDTELMLEYAAEGMMAGLEDPYSYYYTPEAFEQQKEDDEGKYVGIGVSILSSDPCVITRVFKGSPAEKAGVQRGDILYRVEDDLYVTMETLNEAVSIMRGEPNTTVNVTFIRDGEEITFSILREEVTINQIESIMLEDGIGYIAMYQFAGEVELEFEKALNDLIGEGAKGIIIDLRDNPGGWVHQAQYIGDLFMDQGEVCYFVYRDGSEDHRYYKTYDGKADVKLVVLVNGMSASSSEILTGALRDCADATVVGTTTFGKGIVQEVIPVGENGAGFQLTIAQYLSPKGNKVHEVGITPDVVIEPSEDDNGSYNFADTEKDIQLRKALEVMREKLK